MRATSASFGGRCHREVMARDVSELIFLIDQIIR